MASIQSFAMTPTGRKNIPGSIPTVSVEALVYDDAGALIGDFTGAAALPFPAVLATLTDEQVDRMMRRVATWLLLIKAGLDPGL